MRKTSEQVEPGFFGRLKEHISLDARGLAATVIAIAAFGLGAHVFIDTIDGMVPADPHASGTRAPEYLGGLSETILLVALGGVATIDALETAHEFRREYDAKELEQSRTNQE